MIQDGSMQKQIEANRDDQFIKHQSFEAYLAGLKEKKQLYLVDKNISYKVDKTCREHQPFPKGMCAKCLPPTVVL